MVSQAMLNADAMWALFITTTVAGIGFTTGQTLLRKLLRVSA